MSPRRTRTVPNPDGNQGRPRRRPSVRKFPSTHPEARDEGPRLIPLPENLEPPPGTRRQLELADRMLAADRRRKPR